MSNYEDGVRAEKAVAEMLKSDGWFIANAANLDDIAGHDGAPLVRGEDDNKITPDIHAMKEGRAVWVEVKLKRNGPLDVKKNDQNEHFIDFKNWKSYCEIESESGLEVWLAVVEKPQQTVQRQIIEDLNVVGFWNETDVKSADGEKYGEPGVFIPQSDFMPIDLPPSLADYITEQRQLEGTVDPPGEVLPDMYGDDSDSFDAGQHGLSDFATDGGEEDDDTEGTDE